jgi:hypothetical protein
VIVALAGCSSSIYGAPADGGDEDVGPIAADAAYGGWPYDAPPFDTGSDVKDAGSNDAGDASSDSSDGSGD